MQQHINILGWIYIVLGGLGFLAAVFVLFGTVGGGLLSGDAEAALITSGVGFFVALLVAVLSIPSLIGGWGLLKRRPWARILVMILGALQLLSIPVGTIIGIYTLWALTRPEAQSLLRG